LEATVLRRAQMNVKKIADERFWYWSILITWVFFKGSFWCQKLNCTVCDWCYAHYGTISPNLSWFFYCVIYYHGWFFMHASNCIIVFAYSVGYVLVYHEVYFYFGVLFL
jgi:hypothetical protein